MPRIIIIGGCNGAGKTTAAYSILKDLMEIVQYLNADEIARGLSPFDPDSVAFKAGRIMLQRMHELANDGIDFAFETTLATKSFAPFLQDCVKRGYTVELLFFYLNSVELANHRIKSRVASGGHDIPKKTVERRYKRGLMNLTNLYLNLCHQWVVFNNSQDFPIIISQRKLGEKVEIVKNADWLKINNYGKE